MKKRCRDGVTCVVLCVACTLPSIYLVCVVFGTAAIPASLNIFGKCFSYFIIGSTASGHLYECLAMNKGKIS